MKLFLTIALLVLTISGSFEPAAASPDSSGHHKAMRICKQKYRDAVRGIKRLKGRDRKVRYEQARRDRAECEKLAPR